MLHEPLPVPDEVFQRFWNIRHSRPDTVDADDIALVMPHRLNRLLFQMRYSFDVEPIQFEGVPDWDILDFEGLKATRRNGGNEHVALLPVLVHALELMVTDYPNRTTLQDDQDFMLALPLHQSIAVWMRMNLREIGKCGGRPSLPFGLVGSQLFIMRFLWRACEFRLNPSEGNSDFDHWLQNEWIPETRQFLAFLSSRYSKGR